MIKTMARIASLEAEIQNLLAEAFDPTADYECRAENAATLERLFGDLRELYERLSNS